MTLHEELIAAGIETDHHESDLYFPMTPESTAIYNRARKDGKCAQGSVFYSDGKPWYDVPFVFDPFWKNKARCDETAHYRCEA